MIIVNAGGGGSAMDQPRFAWSGLVNFLDTTPVWRIITAGTFTSLDVDMAVSSAALTLNILVNGTNIQTVSPTATAFATYTISVPVVAGNRLRIQLTSVGTGVAHDLSLLLRG